MNRFVVFLNCGSSEFFMFRACYFRKDSDLFYFFDDREYLTISFPVVIVEKIICFERDEETGLLNDWSVDVYG